MATAPSGERPRASPDPRDRATAQQRLTGAGLCTVSAAGFSTLAILAKLAYAEGLSLPGILCLRFGGAALILVLFLLLRRTRFLFGFRTTVPLFLLGAIGYAVQASLYVGSLQRIPASVSALLLYSYPVFVALLAWWINRRRPTMRELAAMALALAGVILTISPGAELGRADALGLALVLASAVWYAVYITASDRIISRAGSLVSTTWIALGAFLTFTVTGAAMGSLPTRVSPTAFWVMAAMVVFSTVLPIGTFLAGLTRVGPTAASLLSTLEPVFTTLLAAVVLGESLSPRQVAGGALVLTAVVLLSLPTRGRASQARRAAQDY
jgi:drug/metabolite transporter (DMT)-like permease